MPHLFEPFRRGQQEPGAAPQGVGLGLFIVQGIVVAHGGSVEVDSSAEAGTTFTVKLPRKRPGEPRAAAGAR